jgi:hypothetical protein
VGSGCGLILRYYSRSVGRPKTRWLDDVEEDLRKMRIGGRSGRARRRDEWKSVLREVKVLQGPLRHRVQVVLYSPVGAEENHEKTQLG